MSDHLIAEANRHAMALPSTHPTHTEIAWYVREVVELRAENERLTAENNTAHAALNDSVGYLVYEAAIARAKRAEAELATERARMDYMSNCVFEHRHHETGDHLGYEWTISSYSESGDVTLRNLIDEQMIVNPCEKEVRDE